MYKCHFSVGHQANVSILRNKANTCLKRIFKFCKFFGRYSSVNKKYKNWLQVCGSTWQNVLNSSVIRHKFCGQLLLSDVLGIVTWERIFVLTRIACPCFKSEIDFSIGVQYSLTSLARHGCVLYKCHILYFLHGCVDTSDGDDNSCCSNFVAWPKIPAKSNTIF